MAKKDDKKLLETARERFKRCVEADQENRKKAVADLKFIHVPGEQWDETLKAERGTRPAYEFNKTRVTIKRIVNGIRSNRPQAKVRAVEDGDKDTAATLEGLCRNIWSVSDGDNAVDIAAEMAVAGGMGAWRLSTEYSSDDVWDQDIRVLAIRNPLNLWADPSARDPMKRDAGFWFFESKIHKDTYDKKYKDIDPVDWEGSEFADKDDWETDESVKVCEYWYKKPVTKTLALLSNGKTVDAAEISPEMMVEVVDGVPTPITVTKQRTVNTHQICMAIIGGGDKLISQPVDWAGSKFPFIQVFGEHMYIDGKTYWFGLTRFAKDAQRAYNLERTLFIETEAKAPLDTDWATPTQAHGHTDMWARAHKELLPYRLFNPDPQNPGPPVRAPGGQVPPALALGMQLSSEDIKNVTGVFDPSLGGRTNAVSGIAKRAEVSQAEIVCFNYQDNLARGVQYTHELLIDLIPKIYDSERSIRILGVDGAEQYAKVNSPGPNGEVLNDLSRGKFDTTVTIGPNLGTQRQEAAEVYMGLMQGNPGLFPVVGDLVVKTFDYPYSDEMAERIRLMAPPQIQQFLAQKEQSGGKGMDPQAQAAMQQAEQMVQMVQEQSQLVQAAAEEAEGIKQEAVKEKAAAEKAKSDIQLAISNLKIQEAHIATLEAQFKQMVAEAQAKVAGEQQGESDGKNDTLLKQVDQALETIQTEAQAFMADAAQLLQQMQQLASQPVVVDRASNRQLRVKRVNGKLQGQLINSETGEAIGQIGVERINGELVGTVVEQ